ncbi:cell envelope integrity protein TolA [Agarilytica rhodophyticola]|uniref:cell envelope integrity protein TolA n=1 Tax=Agarilytica rhodophyticola TaxID=1737490 RepID=UPI000B34885D|nr:cell envelope integrity protein TolA [Agarilytica rhodophyticola]
MEFLTKFVIPATVSLVIHAGIFLALTVSWEGKTEVKRVIPPKYVEAKLVKLKDTSKKKASAKKQPRKIDLTAKRKEQARLKQEQERKRKARIEKQRKEAQAKKAAEKKKREEELAKKAREEKQRKEKEQQQRLQQEFEQALLEEQGLLQEEEFADEAQSYTSKFRQRVESKWSRPPSARTGMRCVLKIQLVPTGRIVSVNITESSGDSAFDRSAVQAVKKVEVFPEAKEMSPDVFERYYRTFNFSFNPQDLRL